MTESEPSPEHARWTGASEPTGQAPWWSGPGGTPPAPSGPPPGWYPHPSMVNTVRYWDGQRWTDHIAPTGGAAAPYGGPGSPQQGSESGGLIAAGVVTALLFPIIGFIIGIVLLARGRSLGAGVVCMVLALIAFIAWATVMSGY